MTVSGEKKRWRCVICNEIVEGDEPPMMCPVCRAGREAFEPYEETADAFHSDDALNIVVIGSGVAAFSAIEAIRQRNTNSLITLLTNEPYLPYYRTAITKKIARKGTVEESLLKPESWYRENAIDVRLSTPVRLIDTDSKMVVTEKGDTFSYDKLLIATGARSFRPPFKGVDLPEVITLRSFCDLEYFQKLLGDTPKNVTVIGGGLLGLEAAWGLILLGHHVSILEMCPILLPRQLDAEGEPLLRDKVEASASLYLGVEIAGICEESGHVSAVELKTGEHIPTDIVLISAGVRSEFSLVKDTPIRVDRGICVDADMKTSVSDVFAAGDCAICEGRFDGLWDTAARQGKIAGAQMVGDTSQHFAPSALTGASMFAFGTSLFSIGDLGTNPAKDYDAVVFRNELIAHYKKFVFSQKQMVGGILLGDTSATRELVAALNDGFDAEDAKNHGMFCLLGTQLI